MQMKPHSAVFNNVALRKMTIKDHDLRIDMEAAKLGGENIRVANLLRKQNETITASFDTAIKNKMKRAQSCDEKLQVLVKAVDEGIPPLPLSLTERRDGGEGFSMGLLMNTVKGRLAEIDMELGNVLFDLRGILTNPESRWSKVLPRGLRYQVICEVLTPLCYEEHLLDEEAKSRVGSALAGWAKYRDELEYESDLGNSAQSAGPLSLQ